MPEASDPKLYLSLRELSQRTGLSESTIRRLAQRKKIQAHQPGGKGTKLLFRPDAIEKTTSPPTSPDPASNRVKHLSGRAPTWMGRANQS